MVLVDAIYNYSGLLMTMDNYCNFSVNFYIDINHVFLFDLLDLLTVLVCAFSVAKKKTT